MMLKAFSWNRGIWMLLFVVWTAAAWAGTKAGKTADFYYYDGGKILLTRDQTRLMIQDESCCSESTTDTLNLQRRRAAQMGVRLAPRHHRPERGAWLYDVPKGTQTSQVLQNVRRQSSQARAFPVFKGAGNDEYIFIFDEITVRLKSRDCEQEALALCAQLGLEVIGQDPFVPQIFRLRARQAQGDQILPLANQLAENTALFAWAEPNLYPTVKKSYVPNDTYFSNQWHLRNTGQSGGVSGADIGAEQAWNTTLGSSSIIVCHIDDGLDIYHQDLAGNLWTNPGEVAGDGIDNDGNTYIDDVRGWDVCDNDNNVYHDDMVYEGHGTSVAGITAAVGNNSLGVSGLAPACRIFSVKIFKGENYAGDSQTAVGIRYAAQFADVISCSWGGGSPSSDLRDAFIYARTAGRDGKGTPCLAASGNDTSSSVSYPAAQPWLMAVGATDRTDTRFDYSNYGTGLSFVSPSGNWTTDITGTGNGYDEGSADGNYTGSFGGTSSATPLAAGAAALILSKNPGLTSGQVEALLNKTAEKIQSSVADYNAAGYSNEYGYGRLDAAAALAATPSSGANVDDMFEDNDTQATAKAMPSALYKGLVSLDEDWFSVTVSGGSTLNVTLSFINDLQDMQLALYDSGGATILAQSTGSTNEETISYVVPGTGDQTFKIRAYATSYGGYGYALNIDFKEPDDSYEENDSLAQAATVSLGDFTNLRAYDDDYYKVTVPSGMGLIAIISFSSSEADLDLEVYDGNQNWLYSSEGTGNSETVWISPITGNTVFYVHAYAYSGEAGYDMKLMAWDGNDLFTEDALEQNDTAATARDLSPGTYTNLGCLDDDWFRVTVPTGAFIRATIRFSHAFGDLDLDLYGEASQAYDDYLDFSDSSTDDESVYYEGAPGESVYYVWVYGYEGDTNGYDLEIETFNNAVQSWTCFE